MPRRTRQSLRKRAERNVDAYQTPTHLLSQNDARWRCTFMWLQGYDAAIRDMRDRRRLVPNVDPRKRRNP